VFRIIAGVFHICDLSREPAKLPASISLAGKCAKHGAFGFEFFPSAVLDQRAPGMIHDPAWRWVIAIQGAGCFERSR